MGTSTSHVAEGSGNHRSLGGPSKDGPFVLRLKMPSGYKVPAHSHPTDEGATVISGNFHIGMGDKLDEKKAIELTAGGDAYTPGQKQQLRWANRSSVLQNQHQRALG